MARRGIASGRRFSGENGLLMKPPWPNRILLLLLCFVSELLFSSFSPAAHADSGTLYTSVDSVLFKLKKGQEILLVDVRDREAFDRFRIPGSIHVPLYALKTKTFLKEKTVVLVSVGYPDFALEQSCDAVKAVGFGKTSILNGGLRMWMLKKGSTKGLPRLGGGYRIRLRRLSFSSPDPGSHALALPGGCPEIRFLAKNAHQMQTRNTTALHFGLR
jgi:rhodanese-related sulfurtransferase